ncbi:serine/threonine-protein phosphatase 6 regulatory ankyrin repeat subunit B-like [Ylistrum balloti]|uniref:serine/threonine-protein phosphatase 6 regulatory ankyrin repeat subunit B-like n=1 Tax=Ylistrum balloti TaxID=509963 RepID=UPI0029058DE7|nr:serine/threonine-protein phosphatase 6 regulatory ankyrin repeat subunit B-like [Ylistrum balloti]
MAQDVDSTGSRLLNAILLGKARQISSLLDQNVDVDVRDDEGRTPLIYAVCCDIDDVRTHVVRLLLRSNCYINAQDNTGCTALMYACMEADRVDVVRLIARNKSCNPNLQDFEGYTAVMHAVAASNPQGLKTLISSSATKTAVDLNIKNKNGITALELAVKLQLFDCCKVLTTDGASGRGTNNVRDKKGLNLILGREASVMSQRGNLLLTPTLHVPGFSPRGGYASRNATPVPNWSRQNSSYDNNGVEHWQGLRHERVHSSNDGPWVDSPRRIKRTLTPISREDKLSVAFEPESPMFGNKMRLPSIPSGKRLCLVSNQNSFDFSNNGESL